MDWWRTAKFYRADDLTELVAAARDFFTVHGEAWTDPDPCEPDLIDEVERASNRLLAALKPFSDVEV